MDRIRQILRKKETIFIVLIFFVACFMRLYKISTNPVSLSMDEVSLGYNAYSILQTGRDEWGKRFPLAFRSVGDYKPPVNIYLTVPSIAIFGLNEFAVRFPVALIGALTVIVFTYLLKELGIHRIGYLFGGFWLAVSPWHVHFSRGSFEAVTALFFAVLGTYLFLIFVRNRSFLYLSLSLLSLALSLWSYHAERVFTLLLVLFLYIQFRKKIYFIWKEPKKLLLSILPFVILTVPFLYLTIFTKTIRERAISTSIFREQSLIRILHEGNYPGFADKVFDNDSYLVFRHFMGKYMNYYDLRFWFWKGMQYTPPNFMDMGVFYLVDILIIPVGIYMIFMSKNKLLKNLSLFWFFTGPVPAAFTMNEQHPLRALVWLPFFGVAAAMGFVALYTFFKNKKKFIFVYGLLLILNMVYFADMYFRQFPRFSSEYWQYGYKDISLYACQNKNKYQEVYVTDTFGSVVPNNTGIPGLYILFYCKIDPKGHFTDNAGFEKIKIKRMVIGTDTIPRDSLIIGSYWDLPFDKINSKAIVKTINYPSGKPAFVFVDTNKL